MGITEEFLQKGTKVDINGVQTILTGESYQDGELGLMLKSDAFPGGMPADKHQLIPVTMGTEVTIAKKAVIVFKGKMVGDIEETEITPALIEERSKPLLALKINGIFDNEGAEAVKAAIQKAVKMRTLVEKQEDPEIKRVNAAAKKRVADIREISKPIYDACLKTQNTLQATYNAWESEVLAAKQKEIDALKAKTEGREKKMFDLGLTWNGEFFVGYGRSYAKEYLHNLAEVTFFELVGELEGLKMEQDVTGKVAEPVTQQPSNGFGSVSTFSTGMNKDSEPGTQPGKKVDILAAVYDKTLPDGTRIILTQGEVEIPELNFLIKNDRVMKSGIYVQVTK